MADFPRQCLIEMECGGHRWLWDDGENTYSLDTLKGECSCPQWQYRCRARREDCKHLAAARDVIGRREEKRKAMPFNQAKAASRVTGQYQVPVVQTLSAEENERLKEVFA